MISVKCNPRVFCMHYGRVHALTRCGNQIRFGVSRAQSFSNFQQLILYIIDVGLDWDVFPWWCGHCGIEETKSKWVILFLPLVKLWPKFSSNYRITIGLSL